MADLRNFSRKESLVERKRRQWAQEKAELQEWYPFGKPGAGAPLKSPLLAAADQPTKSCPQDLAYNCQAAAAAADVGRTLPLRNGVDGFDGINGPSSVVMPQRMDATPYVSYNTGENSYVKLYPFPYSAFYHETGQFYHPNHQVATNGLMQAQIACPPPPPPARFDGFVPQGQAAGQLITATDSLYSAPINRPADPFACPYYHGAIGQPRLMPSNTAMSLNHAFPCASSTPYRALSTTTSGLCPPPGGAFQESPIGIEMDKVNNMVAPATAYVSPMIFGQQMPQPSSCSPNECDVRSLCSGGDAVDSSLLTMHDHAMSKSYPGTSDEYGIHKRRAIVTAPRNEHDLEERRARSIQQKKAIDEQIQEQRRKKLEEAEKERKEMERIERERQRIEYREAMESKMERSKWKRMQDLEQMRENAILESWEKAKEDAALMKHARLRKHASLSNNEDEFVLVAGLNGLISEDACPTANGMSSSSAFSDNNSEGSHSRSDYGRVPSRIAADERPIKPLSNSSPFDMWDDLISKQRSAVDAVKLSKKDSTTAGETKENGAPFPRRTNGQDSLHRSKSDLAPIAGNGLRMSRPKASLRTSIVRPLMRRRQEKTTPEEAPTASLPKSAGLGERLSKKLSFGSKSGKKESSSNGLPPQPLSPSAKTKGGSSTASSLISQLSASLHIGSRKSKRQQQPATIASSVPLTRKNRASVFVPENPFGDSFGGLNPLCQPLNTRNRRTKRTAEMAKENVVVDKNDDKLNNGSMEKSLPSSLSNSSSTGEYDTVSSPPCTFSRSPSLRSPSLSGFNSKSPLYQTISSKIRCSTESQKKVMEQLLQLRKVHCINISLLMWLKYATPTPSIYIYMYLQQLKEKQKAIEDAILKPMAVQKPSSLAAGNGL
ncbi:hypothetical protein TTRE_0000308701 [Trichuris trichiura]|uniref:Uncharacterized protein n=1 Tax=Trichuris trichiura TaxID=36087 RepID=A0A077Z2V9_TRITR|nr:hypothetical protein TTRE_0000308701 [Trichuris trichiura]